MFAKFEEYQRTEKKVVDLTDNGKCVGCGNCCSNRLPLSNKEKIVIRNYIKKHNIKPQIHCVPLADKIVDLTCPFMRNFGNKRCVIYDVRPRVCREFLCSEGSLKADMDYVLNYEVTNVRKEFFGQL